MELVHPFSSSCTAGGVASAAPHLCLTLKPVPFPGLSWVKSQSFFPYPFALYCCLERREVILALSQISLWEWGLREGKEAAGSIQATGGVFPTACFEESPSEPKITAQICLPNEELARRHFSLQMLPSPGVTCKARAKPCLQEQPWLTLFLTLAQCHCPAKSQCSIQPSSTGSACAISKLPGLENQPQKLCISCNRAATLQHSKAMLLSLPAG